MIQLRLNRNSAENTELFDAIDTARIARKLYEIVSDPPALSPSGAYWEDLGLHTVCFHWRDYELIYWVATTSGGELWLRINVPEGVTFEPISDDVQTTLEARGVL